MVGGCGPVATVVIVRLQPPAKLPGFGPLSSLTNSDHTPLGLCPLRVDNVVPYGPAGAGEGKVSVLVS